MKLQALFESMDFIPSFYNKDKGYNETPSEKIIRDCTGCEGTGKNYPDDPNSEPCYYCKDTPGKEDTTEYTVPYMNVSNSNGALILQMLGLYTGEDDESGIIANKDLPAIKRKLIMLKNTNTDKFTRPTTDTKGKSTSYVDKS